MTPSSIARFVAVPFLGIAIIAGGAWLFSGRSSNGHANPDDSLLTAFGNAVYRQRCASCHGANLEGQPNWRSRQANGRLPAPPHDETGHTWHHPDEHLFRITKFGLTPPLAPEGYQSDMPAFGEALIDDEIWAVLAFIKSQWPAGIRARQQGINRSSSR